MRPLIGIPTSTSGDAAVPRFHSNQAYSQAITAAGGAPMLIPTIQNIAALQRLYESMDGLLLPGGPDVEPWRYGEEPGSRLITTDPHQDRTEIQLIEWALADDLPILAICRGQQMLNVAMGGSLVQDIEADRPGSLAHRVTDAPRDFLAHSITVEPATRLASILQTAALKVNSLHHQAIKALAPGLVPTAHAPDGIIEGAESPEHRFVVAVQFHPEELYRHDSRMLRLFRIFVEQAALEAQSGR